MKYNFIFSSAVLISTALAAYVPSDPWSTLTPSAPAPTGASTDYSTKFGIQIKTVSAGTGKRDAVNQIGDGQIQKQSGTVSHPATATVINQIGDGQIQHQTAASVINQIGDGQIQHQTAATTAPVINQIGDGQIQHQTAPTTAPVINQIGDGQIQHQTTKTASVINQIGDGQIQHQTTASAATQISDGQVQQPTDTAAPSTDDSSDSIPKACLGENSLTMTLKGSQLVDSKGRIGAIVANRQFQFDGPPPQAGSIYAAGWSVTKDGLLALGDQTIFYQCASGDFYNLYDQNIAAQCSAVHLSIIDLVSC